MLYRVSKLRQYLADGVLLEGFWLRMYVEQFSEPKFGFLARSIRCSACRVLFMLVGMITTLLLSSNVVAQTFTREGRLDEFASEALSTLGLVMLPNESASTLSINSADAGSNSFRSIQIGGGRRFTDDLPLWIEGYAGYQRYSPQLFLNDGNNDLSVRAKWSGFATTGGIGWDFKLTNNWSFRPILNLSLGRIISDVTVSGASPDPPGPILDFLGDGGLTVGGYGGALMLEYEERARERDVDFTLRYSQMRLVTIGNSSGVDASSDVAAAAAWLRVRYPIPDFKLLGRPIKSVWEASLSTYPGDQGKLLNVDWLGSLGAGIELDTENMGLPIVSRLRIMARYVLGEDYNGYSIGFGLSF
jgi:hypothetical protein